MDQSKLVIHGVRSRKRFQKVSRVLLRKNVLLLETPHRVELTSATAIDHSGIGSGDSGFGG